MYYDHRERARQLIKNCRVNVNMGTVNGPKLLLEPGDRREKTYSGFFLGTTPLMMASQQGNVVLVKYLMKHGALVNKCDSLGLTALSSAASNNHVSVCQVLLKKGAIIDSREDICGFSALFFAVRKNNFSAVQCLVRREASLELPDIDGKTVLHHAAWNYNKTIMEYLLKNGANIDARDAGGLTPLHLLLRTDIVNEPKVADEVNYDKMKSIMTWIQIVSKSKKQLEIYTYTRTFRGSGTPGEEWIALTSLIKHGADIFGRDNTGRMPLHVVAEFLPCATVSESFLITDKPKLNESLLVSMLILIKAGADVNEHDYKGNTLLDICKQRKNYMGAKMAARHSKSPNVQFDSQMFLTPSSMQHTHRQRQKLHLLELGIIRAADMLFSIKDVESSKNCCVKCLTRNSMYESVDN